MVNNKRIRSHSMINRISSSKTDERQMPKQYLYLHFFAPQSKNNKQKIGSEKPKATAKITLRSQLTEININEAENSKKRINR